MVGATSYPEQVGVDILNHHHGPPVCLCLRINVVPTQLGKGRYRPGEEERNLGDLLTRQCVAFPLGGHVHGDSAVRW